MTEVTALAQAPTPCALEGDGAIGGSLGIGTPRGEEPERGGSKRRAGELYRVTARDGAALKTRRQVVEGD
jgi:hypothetical protein